MLHAFSDVNLATNSRKHISQRNFWLHDSFGSAVFNILHFYDQVPVGDLIAPTRILKNDFDVICDAEKYRGNHS